MNREDQEFKETLELLREAHREPIAEAHYAAVRARVLSTLSTEQRPVWRWIWVYGLAAALILAAFVGRTPWSARVPLDPLFVPPGQSHVSDQRPAGGPAADQGVRPTKVAHNYRRNRALAAAYQVVGPPAPQPLIVKLVTNDPNVVIYWISGE